MQIIRNLPNQEYHRKPVHAGLSSSGIKMMMRSPSHYRAMIDNPPDQTPAMSMGELVHMATLEPDRFAADVVVSPECDRRTKAGKELYTEFVSQSAGKRVVSASDYDLIKGMADSVRRRQTVQGMLAGCEIEVSIFWQHEFGFMCKCRPDAIHLKDRYLIDLKTCQDASPSAFGRDCAKYSYDVQAAWYLNGAAIATGDCYYDFYFVAVEKAPPHEVMVYAVPQHTIQIGLSKIRQITPVYADCLKSNVWPGYPDEIINLQMPAWAEGV
jgi:hypothetical protein